MRKRLKVAASPDTADDDVDRGQGSLTLELVLRTSPKSPGRMDARDNDIPHLKHNVLGLTKALLALKVPVIVTTTTEKMWGPLIPELSEVLRGVKTIERTTVNAWDEKRVVDAVKATGRKKLIVTGISTDVCLAFPAIAALADGYDSYAVIDASGGFTQTQVDMGVLRMQQAGVIPVNYSMSPLRFWPTTRHRRPRLSMQRSACRSAGWSLV